jgi:hypothetical protein
MDNTQPTVDFDDLSPTGTAAVVIEVNGFIFVGETIFLNQLIASFMNNILA